MNFTTKALAAAIALAGASAAQAATSPPANLYFGSDTGNSSMILAVWDDVRRVSYVRDLGIRFLDFLPTQPGYQTFATTARFSETFFAGPTPSNTADIRWAVAGGERVGQARIATTRSNLPATLPRGTSGAISTTLIGFDSIISQGRFTTTDNSFSSGPAIAGTAHSVNDERFLSNPVYLNGFGWVGNLGEAMNFVLVTGAAVGPLHGPEPTIYANLFYLQADGTLQYVPVPAAVWLLGSALAGMGLVSRRREA